MKTYKSLNGEEIPISQLGWCECKWCTEVTDNLSTKMCDSCWELDHRIRGNPKLAKRILQEVAPSEVMG